MVDSYATTHRIFTDDISDGALFVDGCTTIDNVCHGREGHGSNFFLHICVPIHIFKCVRSL